MTWSCWGVPPKIPSCGAGGESQAEAERHVKYTGHSVGPYLTKCRHRGGTEDCEPACKAIWPEKEER